ncbi:unnamed protein product [Vitrella brassicaformis CCMP3155]|uniref:SET domain-containing protein n=1 Tax=Vitrella brassicaformis (strain CCMP3155) TaxID=1169540 RepID=A0A0G4H6A1_VITBC|nr:unnamed protein product [Vitrella brassicaformis CCMP3155]|eukprot:CEM39231.1 unnamed protein product [Vitrella brassicaformis CCMP3155]
MNEGDEAVIVPEPPTAGQPNTSAWRRASGPERYWPEQVRFVSGTAINMEHVWRLLEKKSNGAVNNAPGRIFETMWHNGQEFRHLKLPLQQERAEVIANIALDLVAHQKAFYMKVSATRMKDIVAEMLLQEDELLETIKITDTDHPAYKDRSEQKKGHYGCMAIAKKEIGKYTAIGLYGGDLIPDDDNNPYRQKVLRSEGWSQYYSYSVTAYRTGKGAGTHQVGAAKRGKGRRGKSNRPSVDTDDEGNDDDDGMMNDPRFTRKKANVVVLPCQYYGIPLICHVTLEDVAEGEELLVRYGSSFWDPIDQQNKQQLREYKVRDEMQQERFIEVKKEKGESEQQEQQLRGQLADRDRQVADLKQQLAAALQGNASREGDQGGQPLDGARQDVQAPLVAVKQEPIDSPPMRAAPDPNIPPFGVAGGLPPSPHPDPIPHLPTAAPIAPSYTGPAVAYPFTAPAFFPADHRMSDEALGGKRKRAGEGKGVSDGALGDDDEGLPYVKRPPPSESRSGEEEKVDPGDLFDSIPVDEDGQLWSVGSIGHPEGRCHPCNYVRAPGGCRHGVKCQDCHLKHPPKWRKEVLRRRLAALDKERHPDVAAELTPMLEEMVTKKKYDRALGLLQEAEGMTAGPGQPQARQHSTGPSSSGMSSSSSTPFVASGAYAQPQQQQQAYDGAAAGPGVPAMHGPSTAMKMGMVGGPRFPRPGASGTGAHGHGFATDMYFGGAGGGGGMMSMSAGGGSMSVGSSGMGMGGGRSPMYGASTMAPPWRTQPGPGQRQGTRPFMSPHTVGGNLGSMAGPGWQGWNGGGMHGVGWPREGR